MSAASPSFSSPLGRFERGGQAHQLEHLQEGLGDGVASKLDAAIEQYPPGWNELEQIVEVRDVGSQDRESELLRLKKQNASLQSAKPCILLIALEPAQDT
ncbi:hypothetical protein [Mesorhizobium sp.]|uniref:hypothetical protein n=1 Tax=Mesorhizobium sp. TaxID=1871066 RepID=UPI0026C24DC5